MKMFAFALLATATLIATPAFARHGADDPAGHVRQGRGADDGAGHTSIMKLDDLQMIARRGRGADDGAGHTRQCRGCDDGPNHT